MPIRLRKFGKKRAQKQAVAIAMKAAPFATARNARGRNVNEGGSDAVLYWQHNERVPTVREHGWDSRPHPV